MIINKVFPLVPIGPAFSLTSPIGCTIAIAGLALVILSWAQARRDGFEIAYMLETNATQSYQRNIRDLRWLKKTLPFSLAFFLINPILLLIFQIITHSIKHCKKESQLWIAPCESAVGAAQVNIAAVYSTIGPWTQLAVYGQIPDELINDLPLNMCIRIWNQREDRVVMYASPTILKCLIQQGESDQRLGCTFCLRPRLTPSRVHGKVFHERLGDLASEVLAEWCFNQMAWNSNLSPYEAYMHLLQSVVQKTCSFESLMQVMKRLNVYVMLERNRTYVRIQPDRDWLVQHLGENVF